MKTAPICFRLSEEERQELNQMLAIKGVNTTAGRYCREIIIQAIEEHKRKENIVQKTETEPTPTPKKRWWKL